MDKSIPSPLSCSFSDVDSAISHPSRRSRTSSPATPIFDPALNKKELGKATYHEDLFRMEEIATLKSNRKHRTFLLAVILCLFVWINYTVISMIERAVDKDNALMQAKVIQSTDRLITEKVYLMLIGGTVVEIASLLLVISGYLFPRK